MKTKKLYAAIFLFAMVAILSNCTVQKRSYRSGYYVSWNKRPVSVLKTATPLERKKAAVPIAIGTSLPLESKENEQPLKQDLILASAQKSGKVEVKSRPIKSLSLLNDSCGDLIVLRDGSEINAKVTEINPKTVKYKRCDNLTGPNFVINAEGVFMIRYQNGNKEVFKQETVEAGQSGSSQQSREKAVVAKKTNPMAIASLATFVLYLTIILSPIPLVFGLIALHQMNKHPEKYKGKWMAVVGVFPGLVTLFIILLALMFVAL